jgi:hypothetical protein
MQTEELSEIATLLQGTPDKAPEPAEERTEPEPPQVDEDQPLAAEAPELKQDAADTEPAEEQNKPLTVKALAEKLGMPVKTLYKELTIETADGETFTLADFKDRGKDLRQADGMLASVEERRIAQTNEIEQQRHDAQLALSLPDMSPEQRQTAYGHYTEQQNALAVQTIEGWQTPGTREAELGEISSLLQEYGVPQARANNTVDAVELRILADYNRLRKRVSAAAAKVVKPKSDKQLPNRQRGTDKSKAAIATDKFNKGEISQNDAITALIANG